MSQMLPSPLNVIDLQTNLAIQTIPLSDDNPSGFDISCLNILGRHYACHKGSLAVIKCCFRSTPRAIAFDKVHGDSSCRSTEMLIGRFLNVSLVIEKGQWRKLTTAG